MIVNVLAWGFVAVGSSFCVLLAWFAVRIVSQLDRLNDLVTRELHEHDIRLVTLEVKAGIVNRRAE